MAIDWTAGMGQAYEVVAVDAETWTEQTALANLVSCSITRENSGLLVSANMEVDAAMSAGYYRVYLIAEQGAEKERVALATVLCESDSISGNGKVLTRSVTGYGPLKELEDTLPPLGWACTDVETGIRAVLGHVRAPWSVDGFDAIACAWVAEESDTWLDVLESLCAIAGLHMEQDGYGRLHAAADVDASALLPSYTFADDEGSILLPDLSVELNRADVPNRYEVVYSTDSGYMCAYAENNDANNAVSIPSRGRTVTARETSPDVADGVTQTELDALAVSLLKSATATTRTQSYSHGFTPDVQVGSCVLLSYSRAGYEQKAIVVKQTIDCATGCTVEETAEWCESSAVIENVEE